jgi:hypothetical protein
VKLKDGRKAFRIGTDFPDWKDLLGVLTSRGAGGLENSENH